MAIPLKRLQHLLSSLVGIGLLIASLWVINEELKQYSPVELKQSLTSIPVQQIARAIALTLMNCLVFTGYDTLAVHYIRHPLIYRKTAITAITSTAVSNTVGLGLLSGSAIRYRFYTPWGLTPLQITQVIAFVSVSFWLGLFVISGILFVMQPILIPSMLHLPFTTTRPIGILFLGIIVAYLGWNGISSRSLRIQSLVIPHVPLHVCLLQLILSSLDWALAATTLYVLLPASSNLPYEMFLGIYLLAQFAGVVSNVPGGLGVFETVMLLLLPKSMSSAILFGSLITYRLVYYLLPLALAILLLSGYELQQWQRSNND
jgi:uncharacterized membrane protein YbhN (UPF0104 family)